MEIPSFTLAEILFLSAIRTRSVNLVKEACQTYGMFMVVDHGISNDVLTNAMTSAQEFFELPTEELRAISGIENRKCMLYRSSYAHALGKIERPFYWRIGLELNLNTTDEVIADGWPTLPQSFRPNVWEFAKSVEILERGLLSLISEALGLNENYFDGGLCQAPHIVVNHYPKCPEPTQALGMPQHCDPGLLTISLLGDVVPGTQFYIDGEWRAVRPTMNTLLVTVGHQLQVISNGAFKAPIHREVVNSERARTTISRVLELSGDYVVGPAAEITRTDPRKYKSYKYDDYLEHHFLEYRNNCSILEHYYLSEVEETSAA